MLVLFLCWWMTSSARKISAEIGDTILYDTITVERVDTIFVMEEAPKQCTVCGYQMKWPEGKTVLMCPGCNTYLAKINEQIYETSRRGE